jgi:hypothetical protein
MGTPAEDPNLNMVAEEFLALNVILILKYITFTSIIRGTFRSTSFEKISTSI